MTPSLQIKAYHAPHTETYAKNGVSERLVYVVRNTAFSVNVCFVPLLSMAHSTLNLELFDENLREIPLVSNPLQYTSRLTNDRTEAIVNVKLNVLSSQFKTNFVIRVTCTDPSGASTSTTTCPIKSVSKQQVIRRRKLEISATTPKPQRGLKRARGEDIFDALQQIREQLNSQSQLLTRVLEKPSTTQTPTTSTSSSSYFADFPDLNSFALGDFPTAPNTPESATSHSSSSTPFDSFESAFSNLLAAYQRLPVSSRPVKMRKVVSTFLRGDQGDAVRELIFNAHKVEEEVGTPDSYSEDLGSLDGLYQEIFDPNASTRYSTHY
eukprot:CAMPEP_0168518954 /NCGR_PEP_ID=MMETSP0405-20121227/7028_1 /TAXON_ID=498012 /ORGANISM="Trichosphaerium sp, Strain Am-I-7 wt" /LENGTH=322 /DNA_ID=CAMNT_0008539401 /DNA_START=10 /DNA_END=978 /DNA_ORIENTATION=+